MGSGLTLPLELTVEYSRGARKAACTVGALSVYAGIPSIPIGTHVTRTLARLVSTKS